MHLGYDFQSLCEVCNSPDANKYLQQYLANKESYDSGLYCTTYNEKGVSYGSLEEVRRAFEVSSYVGCTLSPREPETRREREC